VGSYWQREKRGRGAWAVQLGGWAGLLGHRGEGERHWASAFSGLGRCWLGPKGKGVGPSGQKTAREGREEGKILFFYLNSNSKPIFKQV